MIKENVRNVPSGLGILVLLIVLFLASVAALIFLPPILKVVPALWLVVNFFLLFGVFYVNPNEARVLQLFGKYVGTCKQEGLRWANPFYTKKRISLRIRNFETGRMKVNDIDGNPIEIATIVVWKVVDTAEACFEVDDYEQFVKIQSEAAVRNLATQHPYDTHEDSRVSLRGDTATISDQLRVEIQDRLDQAGVQVQEARISHLAYAQEIAEAMLRRQQAGAIVAARQLIVEGAVGMVEMALDELSKKSIIELDHERKAAMVSNLLVVLCGETSTQPVINTGTLYQ
ncbi:MAG: SPFH domain-containing protein [candidate division Zixibacteria bacterium]|nr:SPFH domain-containing protein [candidate division Zixibacteria bacterium]